MTISEQQLDTWSKQGPTAQFTSTYNTIGNVLKDGASPYAGQSFQVFLQGSYKNDTNVYGDSDVDIVIRLDTIYYNDQSFLKDEEKARFVAQWVSASYSLADFKSSVTAWLQKKFPGCITPGNKAIFVKGNDSRRDADVVVCAKLRRFYSFPAYGQPTQAEGICFFLPDGITRIENFPSLHSDNTTTKHQATNQWFKPTVRVFKNLRNALVKSGTIPDGLAPSYFIEGLLYNVPPDRYGGTKQQNFRDVLDYLLNADRNKFVCANEQFYLLRNSPVTWPADNCAAFLNAATQYWNS